MNQMIEGRDFAEDWLQHRLAELEFPAGFEFGLSNSCNQTEGAVHDGGKGVSIWDVFPDKPGVIIDGSNQERAIDHYHRFRSDFELLGQIGPQTYRPSIAWSRIDPVGDGNWNEEGLNYYSEVVDELLAHGIEPWITLYHWDMPQALQDRGGWESRETASRFVDFALKVQEQLGDRVSRWTTFEEPSCVALMGYGSGRHAPGLTNPASALCAAHHVLLAHGMATTAMRNARPGSQVGISLVFAPVEAVSTSPQDLEAVGRVDLMVNRFFLEPVLDGGYADDALALIGRYTDSSFIKEGDAALIAAPIDFLGVNYYFRDVIKSDPAQWNPKTINIGSEDVVKVDRGGEKTLYGWEIYHDGLRDILMRLHYLYPSVPLYVTEAGCSYEYPVTEDGAVHDAKRIEFLANQFAVAHQVVRAGVDLRGFCVWTFMDNWEWAMGWTQRFGLVHVDRNSLERTMKDSGNWYRNLIHRNAIRSVTSQGATVDATGF